jgi:hypothetical protein
MSTVVACPEIAAISKIPPLGLGAEIKSLDDRRATVTTELIAGPEGGAWYTVALEKENNQWVVTTAT